MNEFELIRHYFSFSKHLPDSGNPDSAVLGVGDDCALLNIPEGQQLAVTTDTLVCGVHFPAEGDPSLIARRALRVNLSDLAAMGATPLAFQLALTLPAVDEAWGMVFIEAAALGVASVAGASGGVAAVIASDETGILTEAGDPASFAAGVRRALENPHRVRAMGVAARKRAQVMHDTDSAAMTLAAVLAELT